MEQGFKNSFDYKIIYVFEILDEKHKGLLKIGDATLHTTSNIDVLVQNSRELNQAALKRIKAYTNTAGFSPKLLHTELAVRTIRTNEGVQLKAFRDHDVHTVLKNSGYKNVTVDESTGKEWFEVDIETVKKAILAVKNNAANLSNTKVVDNTPIIFRPEQEEAIKKTLKQFKKADRMLWNAKMRFGKTICALEVVKQMDFHKTIILTHRPVVNAGWYDDFNKVFRGNPKYIYGSKTNGYTVDELLKREENFVYFASVQDLRGSVMVGGKFDKNNAIFSTIWDCVIVDEAHEGTTTLLGEDTVKAVLKEGNNTKLLALSGTPFNILDGYDDDSIYTWDYVMEQECKSEWDKEHFGDSNPYEELPELRIFTYDLGQVLKNSNYITFEDKAFNFHEFFRTYTSDDNVPESACVGDFVHEKDILSFLNLLTKSDNNSMYPYSNEEYRSLFKHTLWMLPGVKEAKALKKIMLKHPIFGNGQFEIVNVAGNGDEEEKSEEALTKVKKAINDAKKNGTYTITLSCGKLTTGVTVREWTGVFMLSGSYSTSAANYLQTIFRVQSPCNEDGMIKDTSYVFDFAPDRTLKMVASAVSISAKAGKGQDTKVLGKFLNYCPVIAISGSEMKEYSSQRLLQQLKRAYADKVVRNGFDDSNLYSDELFMLDEVDIQKFDELKGIIGTTAAAPKANDITVNEQGLTKEEYEELEKTKKKPKRELTEEEKARLEELKQLKKLRNDAISILRGISIRMPLLIYGAEIPYEDEITLDKFVDMVDDSSWEEFMPYGVTKEKFKEFQKYYDEDIFIAAGRKIRNIAKEADTLTPTERVIKIAGLFKYFKNPDKETVLTPWRVVNMHISDCFGGWDFFDKEHDEENALNTPRFVDKGEVTKDIFCNPDTKILEINSKTGLYPLYMTYSVFMAKCQNYGQEELTPSKLWSLWYETVLNNIFIICKTPMAKAITKRTLLGFTDKKFNAHYFDDLLNIIANKPYLFIEKVLKESYWKKGNGTMHFDALISNPPYQRLDGGNSASASPIYNEFVENSIKLNPTYLSIIMPARWYIGGKGLDDFRSNMLNDKHISKIVDFPNCNDVFPSVDIAGGVCYFLRDNKEHEHCEIVNYDNGKLDIEERKLNQFDVLVRSNKSVKIIEKVLSIHKGQFMDEIVSVRKPFGLPTNYEPQEKGIPCCFIQKIGIKFAKEADVDDTRGYLNKWKYVAPKSPIAGQTDFTKPVGFYYDGNTQILPPGTCCTESFIVLYAADNKEEVESFKSYLLTKTVRFLLLQCVASQDVTREKYKFVPHLGKYEGTYTDKALRKMWNITEDEWNYIDSRICNIKGN